MGKFNYQTGEVTHSGEFNVYQARHGGIMLLMGKEAVCLTQNQAEDLAIDLYSLTEFDVDAYRKFYDYEPSEQTPQTDHCFTLEDMEGAFDAGVNRGVDITLIIEHNGKHDAITGYPSRDEWMSAEYGK